MKERLVANKINEILSEWDPIGVEKLISDDEYRQYVPEITRAIDSMENLEKALIHIIDQIGLSYDMDDDIFQKNIRSTAEKIFNLESENES